MRIREYTVGMRQFHTLFCGGGSLTRYQVIDRLYYPDIPQDAKLHHIELSRGGMCWSVYIEHPSFDDVPEFQYPPSEPMVLKSYPVLCAADKDWVLDGMTREQLIAIREALDRRIAETPVVVEHGKVIEVTPTATWEVQPRVYEENDK